MSDAGPDSEFVVELAEEFIDRYRQGERPPLAEYTSRYPELAERIRDVFPAMAMLENIAICQESGDESEADVASRQPAHPSSIGDFRIVREVGRGGMGIVYEAEQLSLGRRVALKVLPQQSILDKKHQRRFDREAKAAARLHHTNIVPVFGVGEHDGLHYYVMQFIQGLGLDEVIEELRHLKQRPGSPQAASGVAAGGSGDVSAVRVARSLMTGQFERTVVTTDELDAEVADITATVAEPRLEVHQSGAGALEIALGSTAPSDAASGSLSDSFSLSGVNPLSGQSDGSGSLSSRVRRKQSFWTSVAGIGQQVASALHYAHDQGITHRDIKPSNLLLPPPPQQLPSKPTPHRATFCH